MNNSHQLTQLLAQYPVYTVIGIAVIIVGALAFLFASVALLLRKTKRLELIYLIFALPMAILYLFLVPPMSAPDERSHFNTAYAIACDWYGVQEAADAYHHYVRPEDNDAWFRQEYVKSPADFQQLWENYNKTVTPTQSRFQVLTEFTYNKKTITYYPSAFMIWIGFHLGWSFTKLAFFATLPNMALCLLGMYFAIKKMPFAKSTLVFLSCLPIVLQQGSSLSYDAYLLPASFLAASIFFNWFYHRVKIKNLLALVPISRFRSAFSKSDYVTLGDLIALLACFLVLSELKGAVCLPIFGLAFLLVLREHGKPLTAKKRILSFAAVAIAIVLLYILFGGSSRIGALLTTEPFLWSSFSYARSPMFFIQHPGILLSILAKTFINEGRDIVYQMAGGRLGWLHMYANHYISYLITLLLLLTLIRTGEETVTLRINARVIMILFGALPCLLSVVAMLFYNTPADSDQILGLQGRYFLPSLLPLLIGFTKWQKPRRRILTDERLLPGAFLLIWLSTLSSYFNLLG